jgi:hypothetical protein
MMRRQQRATRSASTNRFRSLPFRTTSALSRATSVAEPTATPTLASVRAGASLMPSPTMSLGLLLKGRLWRRPDDTFGVAGLLNGLSKDHRDYLAAGGLGFIIGDGALNYGLEKILEVFYIVQVTKGMFVMCDFQEVGNPAYNRDRGPVAIWSLRVHTEF